MGDSTDDHSLTSGQPREQVVLAASQGALAAGVDVINGITVGGGQALVDYYAQFVIGGSVGGVGATVVGVPGVAGFAGAATTLVGYTVVAAVPEPGGSLLAVLGGLVFLRRRRREGGQSTH